MDLPTQNTQLEHIVCAIVTRIDIRIGFFEGICCWANNIICIRLNDFPGG